MVFQRASLLVVAGLLTVALASPAKPLEKRVNFSTQIKPLFKTACYGCHGAVHPKGGLDLSTNAGILKGGESGKLFKVGKGSESYLVKRLKGQGGTQMPKGSDPLKEAQIKLITKWIDEGARM